MTVNRIIKMSYKDIKSCDNIDELEEKAFELANYIDGQSTNLVKLSQGMDYAEALSVLPAEENKRLRILLNFRNFNKRFLSAMYYRISNLKKDLKSESILSKYSELQKVLAIKNKEIERLNELIEFLKNEQASTP